MKRINKRLIIILLSGYVLINSCKDINVISKKNTVLETPNIEKPLNNENIDTNKENNVIKIDNEENNPNDLADLKTSDQEITNYINDINSSIDKEYIKENVLKKFIILTDFIFYDTKINGIKYSDLKDSTKKEVLDIYATIDSKIETKFPNYKNDIGLKYNISTNYLKNKYIELSENLKDKVIEKIGEETYNSLNEANKEIIEQDKENLEMTKDILDESTNKAKTKIQKYYEEIKNKY